MGALGNRANYLYLSVSKGSLVNKKKNIDTRGYEGLLIGIAEKQDEYQGQPVTKVQLKMKDPKTGEIAIVEFNEESWYSIGFFSRIHEIDLTRPFIVGVSASDKNEKISFCWLGQKGLENETTGKETANRDKTFPVPEKKTLGRKEIMDWSAPLERIAAIMDSISEKLGEHVPAEEIAETAANKPATPFNPFAEESLSGPGDDLPF